MKKNGQSDNQPWQQAVIYEVYIKSFNEYAKLRSNGQGDLRGVTEKLDYLKKLGVNALWICPFYPSPQIDGGYDITNHCEVDPIAGNLQDFDELIEQAHLRSLNVMVDLIPNHTSDKHIWFQDSTKYGDKSDWYTWRDPKPDGSPPNNWASFFSRIQHERRKKGDITVAEDELTPPVSAWTYHETRGQYYLHSFSKYQPDLNWENPNVRNAIKDIMRFWIQRGVDGFRVDAIPYLGKDPSFRDEQLNSDYHEKDRDKETMQWPNPYDQLQLEYSAAYMPKLTEYLAEISSVLDEYSVDLRIIYEAYLPPEKLHTIDCISPHNSSSFNFTPLDIPWQAQDYKLFLDNYYRSLPNTSVGNQVRDNHDRPRIASPDVMGMQAARSVAVLNLTLPGNIFIYNGEEGGFSNVSIPSERRHDLLGFRDESRTPMLWDNNKNAGFSDVRPEHLWLPIDPDYKNNNLARQAKDSQSFLCLYSALLKIRNSHPALLNSFYTPLQTDNRQVFAFARIDKKTSKYVVSVINFSDQPQEAKIKYGFTHKQVLVTSYMDNAASFSRDKLMLRSYEAVVLE